MSNKGKSFAAPVPKALPHASTPRLVNSASTLQNIPATSTKRNVVRRKVNSSISRDNYKNTLPGESPSSTSSSISSSLSFDASAYRHIELGRFKRATLEKNLVEEKIKREAPQIEGQMALLVDRMSKTMDLFNKTNARLKNISFIVEQKRLLDLKSNDTIKFCEMAQNSDAERILNDLASSEQVCLDKLELKNVIADCDEQNGSNKLLEAIDDALKGLAEIKNNSKLDVTKTKEYEKTQINLGNMEKEKFDLENLRSDFNARFPNFSEKLIKNASDKIALMVNSDCVNDDVEDSDEDEFT
ncbi:uncharacterized protein [Battus philenor]|uniref:uncharacterized protein n=1 Tax=Battus philenor TaxID=42288 RepID=UPI0035CEFD5F